jgi:SSS family solute:Na+ symporter
MQPGPDPMVKRRHERKGRMRALDWLIMLFPLLICGFIAVYSRRYVRGVADFMAGGRNAGRFLISTARAEQGAGAVVLVATFQTFYVAGFTQTWWYQFSVPVGLLVAISGFVIYRYRQTRAMTLAQFFEMRYSRNFRMFTGAMGFFAGIVNFGVIPVIGARFMVFFLELPQQVMIFHHPVATYLVLMAVFLALCTVMTTTGGQVSVLLTDCVSGMITQLFYVLIAVILVIVFFKWSDTRAMLLDTPKGHSLVNPFDSFGLKDFNIWYQIMGVYLGVYGTMAWQNTHAFNSSAASPHESRMGGILGRWRGFAGSVMVTLLAVCAMTYLKSSSGGVSVAAALNKISDPSTRDQMRLPIALSQLLPVGVKGALLAICLLGIISGDGIHLHSWGTILVQDVILPLRKKPLSTRQHLIILRLGVLGVALWAFLFGALFPQTKYVQMWWAITTAIFVGGAGSAIIGGLYWSRGTTAGAWAGMLVGSILSLAGIGVDYYSRTVLKHDFIFNGQEMFMAATVAATIAYVVVSLLTCRQPHNMDQLLHRGAFADISEEPAGSTPSEKTRVGWLYRLVGIDEQFSLSDRWITLSIFWWSILWVVVFAVVSIACLLLHRGLDPSSNGAWATYWLWTSIYLPLGIGVVTTVWFTIGCWADIREFTNRLRQERVNPQDDGSVKHPSTTAQLASAEIESSSAVPAEPFLSKLKQIGS